jgi:Protein of unknown function (DUF707)
MFNFLRRIANPRSRRRVLVVVRAGDCSLHVEWLEGARQFGRNWDLHISYYGESLSPFPDRPPDVTLSREEGLKAQGTVACLDKLGSRLDKYAWIWLPDDDIAADCITLNRFFEIVMANGFDLSQPALTHNSHIAHDITRQRPHFRWRYTSFVEIMCPCFSQRALKLCRPYLNATQSSWGIDLLFPKALGYPRRGIAIVDETPVRHTRPPMGGDNIPLARKLGVDPVQETLRLLEQHGFPPMDDWPYYRLLHEYAAVDSSGKLVELM